MNSYSLYALLTVAAVAMFSTFTQASPSGTPGDASRSQCGCIVCQCPDCDGKSCTCDVCGCVGCACKG